MKRIFCGILSLILLLGCMAVPAGASALKTTENGIQFIKSQEGFSSKKHWDYSQYSIGYGSACEAGDFPNGITVEQADQLLRKELSGLEASLNAFIAKNNLPLSAAQFDALVSFTYNVGTNWMSGSKLSKVLIGGMFTENDFASSLGAWCHAGSKISSGLVLRRIREAQIFLYGDYTGKNSKTFRYVIFDANGGTTGTKIAFYPDGAAYGALPTATKQNRKFLGWFTSSGMQITETAAASQNLTLTARWQSPKPVSDVFSDMSQDQWYYTYVDELYNASVISGYTDGTFRPNGKVSVGEALKLILLACGNSEQGSTDVHWASGYRSLAISKEYLTAAETASLDAAITRGMIAKLAAAAMNLSAPSKTGVFADTSAGYVLALYNAGIIQGSKDAKGALHFYPNNTISRAELSAIVYRLRTR